MDMQVMREPMTNLDAAPEFFPSLSWLLHGLLGRELQVIVAKSDDQDATLPVRAVLSSDQLLLPGELAKASASRYAVYRACIAHAVAHLRFSTAGREVGELKPMAVAMISALEDARVERLLARELPGVREWFAQGIALSTQKEDLSFSGLVMRLDRALADPSREDGNFWVQKARTLFEEQAAIDLEDHAAFRKMATVLANDLGQLRVPYRVQHYVVPVSYRDDHGYLWAFPDPPQPPVAISFTSSTPPQTDEDGDAVPPQQAQEAPEIELGRFCYPEWDSRAEIERSDWTTVIEKRPAWRLEAGRQIETLAAERFSMRSTLRFTPGQRRRELEGERLHLDSAVDCMVARRTRRVPDPRLFVGGGSQEVTSSVLVLLDLSESTNDPIYPGGPPLLDLIRSAALTLSEAVAAGRIKDRIAVHGFHSDGRSNVSYYRMLDFGASLGPRSQAMVAQAPGQFSTRMGAALRHASRCLATEHSAHRGILLVTDGAPSDIDVHFPNYLVEDARVAVQDARRMGLRVHGLAVDPGADEYVRRIFTAPDFGIVDRPASLQDRLRSAYSRLCRA